MLSMLVIESIAINRIKRIPYGEQADIKEWEFTVSLKTITKHFMHC